MGKLIPSITNKGLYTLSVIVALLLITGGAFYWSEIRPAKIKHDCSWVRRSSDAIPAQPAMTELEMKEKGMLEDCESGLIQGNRFSQAFYDSCIQQNKSKIEEFKVPREVVAAKEWWVKATDAEYKFCLHDKGL